ncbi:MAG: helix-turn-helix transcriptional regulator [bacterium]|nr:helix-turn-helix transcriptional regulator [bacterium]
MSKVFNKKTRPKDDLDRTIEQVLKEHPDMQEEFDRAGQAWNIAFQIMDLRKKAGLTQKQLAELVGTKQSNIARIEDADYTRYTLTTLEKITKALKAKLEIRIIPAGKPNQFL